MWSSCIICVFLPLWRIRTCSMTLFAVRDTFTHGVRDSFICSPAWLDVEHGSFVCAVRDAFTGGVRDLFVWYYRDTFIWVRDTFICYCIVEFVSHVYMIATFNLPRHGNNRKKNAHPLTSVKPVNKGQFMVLHTRTHTHTHTHARTHTHANKHTHTHKHTYMHTQTHTHTHTHTCTRTNMHIHCPTLHILRKHVVLLRKYTHTHAHAQRTHTCTHTPTLPTTALLAYGKYRILLWK